MVMFSQICNRVLYFMTLFIKFDEVQNSLFLSEISITFFLVRLAENRQKS